RPPTSTFLPYTTLFRSHLEFILCPENFRKKVGYTMIEVNDLHKQFGDLEVLKGITCHIDLKEVVCVIGPSGSGKSTFLRCLNMLEEMTSGEVIIDGISLNDKNTDINKMRTEVGMVFQQFNLFPHKSVVENVMLAPQKVRGLSNDDARDRAIKLLEKVG